MRACTCVPSAGATTDRCRYVFACVVCFGCTTHNALMSQGSQVLQGVGASAPTVVPAEKKAANSLEKPGACAQRLPVKDDTHGAVLVRGPSIHMRAWQPRDVHIGRSTARLGQSVWHNPFRVRVDGWRSEVLQAFQEHLRFSPDLQAKLPDLAGATLRCHCSADQKCHADVINKEFQNFVGQHMDLTDENNVQPSLSNPDEDDLSLRPQFIEVFAVTSSLSAACREVGFNTGAFDIKSRGRHAHHVIRKLDFAVARSQDVVTSLVDDSPKCFVWMSPPSGAVDNNHLQKVRASQESELAHFTALASSCAARGTPFVIENPKSSSIWELP